MDAVDLARIQFTITSVYHFFFVPLTLGLSLFVAILQTAWLRTGQERFKIMTKFWGKLFLINFAMGVVTGIVMEFQFGMNWSEFSRFVGDIFGAPLAIEALLAFFLESTFLGVWIFGWDRINKYVHTVSIWLVAIGSNLSALWILIANSFMHQPVGFTLWQGRAEMVDFGALLTNPHVRVQWPHVVTSGMATAAFLVLGISAFHLLRKTDKRDVFESSIRIALVFGTIAIFGVLIVGHSQAQHMVQAQPMKMAAAEALWTSEDPAGMSLFTIGNETERRDVFSIRVPGLLSFLAYNSFSGEVKGINELQQQYVTIFGPGNYIPPVAISYWSFRLMVGAGFLMLGLIFMGLYRLYRRRLCAVHWYLRVLLLAIFLPYLANTVGWIFTELGRSPWIVYGLMTIEDAVSPNVPASSVLVTLIGFLVIYGALMVVDVYLLAKFARQGVDGVATDSSGDSSGDSSAGLQAAY